MRSLLDEILRLKIIIHQLNINFQKSAEEIRYFSQDIEVDDELKKDFSKFFDFYYAHFPIDTYGETNFPSREDLIKFLFILTPIISDLMELVRKYHEKN